MTKLAVTQEVQQTKKARAPQRVYLGTWKIGEEGEVTQLFCGSDFAKVSFKVRIWAKANITENSQFVSLVVREELVI